MTYPQELKHSKSIPMGLLVYSARKEPGAVGDGAILGAFLAPGGT